MIIDEETTNSEERLFWRNALSELSSKMLTTNVNYIRPEAAMNIAENIPHSKPSKLMVVELRNGTRQAPTNMKVRKMHSSRVGKTLK